MKTLQRNALAWRLGPRPSNMSQNDPKTTLLMTSLTKNLHLPNQEIFFRVQSTRMADPFELLNSSLSAIGRGARVLVRQLKTAVF